MQLNYFRTVISKHYVLIGGSVLKDQKVHLLFVWEPLAEQRGKGGLVSFFE